MGLWGMCTILCMAPILSFTNFTASINPIEHHITLEPLPEQEGVEEIVIVVVVGSSIKREGVTVFKEHAELHREFME